MRSKFAALNAFCGILYQLIYAITNMLIRKVMIDSIGIEYLGVNGLFSNILQLLGLVESGIGVAIVYLLYKPISINDEDEIAKLMNYYAKLYRIIAIIVLAIGIIFLPFLRIIIKDNPFTVRQTNYFYICFLLNTVSTYFLAYKTSFLNACQKQYYVSIISVLANIIFTVLKIISLVCFENYLYYLLLIIINTIFVNALVSVVVDRKYGYLKKKRKLVLEDSIKRKIKKDIKALMCHKIGGYILNGTDNIVITYFVGLTAVGLYSNYYLIISMVNIFINQVFNALVPAFGSIIAEDTVNDTNRIYPLYKMVYFVNFILYGACAMILVALMQPFLLLWLGGEKYLLSDIIMLLLVMSFYLGGMRSTPSAIKSAAGIYRQDKFSPICEAVINLVVSVLLVFKIGVAGVIIGTIFSCICMPFWTNAYYVYRDLFRVGFKEYLIVSVKYMILTSLGCLAIWFINTYLLKGVSVYFFIIRLFVTLFVTVIYFLTIFLASDQKENVFDYAKSVIAQKKG